MQDFEDEGLLHLHHLSFCPFSLIIHTGLCYILPQISVLP